MKLQFPAFAILGSLFLFSCVSSKKFQAEQAKNEALNQTYIGVQQTLKNVQTQRKRLHVKIRLCKKNESLKEQVAYLRKTIPVR